MPSLIKTSIGVPIRLAIISLLLVIFSAAARAQLVNPRFTTTPDGNAGLVITGFSATGSGPLDIPGTINGLPVTSLGDRAFFQCSILTGVTIPNSVTSIGNGAFESCALTSVTIPNSVVSIGIAAFNGCPFTNVTIPDSITSIGAGAFSGCPGLTTVTIPSSVTSIGEFAFSGCSALTSITVDAQNSVYSSLNGVMFDKSQATLLQYPSGTSGDYTIPSSVTAIGDQAFSYCTGMTRVTIPDNVVSIGRFAFYGCTGLTTVTVPDSVTTININAFCNCTSLTSVTIPASVTSIGQNAFFGCTNLVNAIFTGDAPTMGPTVFGTPPSNFTVMYYPGAQGFTASGGNIWTDSAGDSYQTLSLAAGISDVFSGSFSGNGWYSSNWFGSYYAANYPWVSRSDLGYIYVSTSDNTNLYLYVQNGNPGSMGWTYTTQAQFPNIYSFSKGTWLYFGGGTSFYNYTSQAWETY